MTVLQSQTKKAGKPAYIIRHACSNSLEYIPYTIVASDAYDTVCSFPVLQYEVYAPNHTDDLLCRSSRYPTFGYFGPLGQHVLREDGDGTLNLAEFLELIHQMGIGISFDPWLQRSAQTFGGSKKVDSPILDSSMYSYGVDSRTPRP